jgi:ACS family hexuronate transporter-like MFS transporter
MPVILIGIGASAHQAWSANIFTTVSDMFPKKSVGSVVGIGGMAGGIGGVIMSKLGGAYLIITKPLVILKPGILSCLQFAQFLI